MSTIINVSSKAEHHQPPERATLKVNIKVERKDKEQATKLARQSANQVSAIFKSKFRTSSDGKVSESSAITWWSMSSLTVSFYNHYFSEGEKKEERCNSNVGLKAKFRDFEELSNVIALLTPIPSCEISSIEWSITEITRASLQTKLRVEAVQSAQSQAKDYANALGLKSLRCLEIQAGSSGGNYGGPGAPMAMMSRRMGGGGNGEEEGLDLKPEDVEISCCLDTKFEAT